MGEDRVRSGIDRRSGLRRLVAPRRSRAALRAGGSRGSQRSIVIALLANVVIAGAKLAAGVITGSSALLAEAAHSAADSVNEVLLGLSLRRARRPADTTHPFGYGGTRFLWAFLAAIFSFLIGGCVSIALAVHQLISNAGVDQFLIGWIVLAVAFAADGTALFVSLAAAKREAALWGQPTVSFLRHTSDPTLRALVVEDSAALIGLLLAGGGLFLHQVIGLTGADAIASLPHRSAACGDRDRTRTPSRRTADRAIDAAGSARGGLQHPCRLDQYRRCPQHVCRPRRPSGGDRRG